MPSSKKSAGSSSKVGSSFESQAAQFFQKNNYKILNRNYRAGHKEIDLIVQKGDTIAFVEVKAAKSKSLGHPIERVTKKKRENLIYAAKQFLSDSNLRNLDFRFDVITFLNGKLEHYPDAFSAEESD
jgi:putative endonuclease